MQEGQIPVSFVIFFYGAMAGLAYFLGTVVMDLDILFWHNNNNTSLALDAALGAGVGLIVVLLSQWLDKTARWARELTAEFRSMVGKLSMGQAFVFAVGSGIAEELLFRGFVQQLVSDVVFSGSVGLWLGLIITSVVFGALHIGQNVRKMWPWTVMAIVLGGVFGYLYIYTGNVLAPIVAHFTINFFNLLLISDSTPQDSE